MPTVKLSTVSQVVEPFRLLRPEALIPPTAMRQSFPSSFLFLPSPFLLSLPYFLSPLPSLAILSYLFFP